MQMLMVDRLRRPGVHTCIQALLFILGKRIKSALSLLVILRYLSSIQGGQHTYFLTTLN